MRLLGWGFVAITRLHTNSRINIHEQKSYHVVTTTFFFGGVGGGTDKLKALGNELIT